MRIKLLISGALFGIFGAEAFERHYGISIIALSLGWIMLNWAAQAIEARSGETREAGLDPKDESAVAESDAPESPTP